MGPMGAIGERALRSVIATTVRSGDVAARFGGSFPAQDGQPDHERLDGR